MSCKAGLIYRVYCVELFKMLCISLKIVKIHVTAHIVFVLVLGRACISSTVVVRIFSFPFHFTVDRYLEVRSTLTCLIIPFFPSCSPSGIGSCVTILLWFRLLHFIRSPCWVCRELHLLRVVSVLRCGFWWTRNTSCCCDVVRRAWDGWRWLILCRTLRCVRISCY
jgi:hypothetical protein